MLSDPHIGSKIWEAVDREIGKPGENRGKVVAHRDSQPPAAFHDREDRRNLRSRLWAADMDPVLPTRATGRMEFSARLLLNSSSGYSRNRVSFLQSLSAYWQALLSALEGNATEWAASILQRISSRRGMAVS